MEVIVPAEFCFKLIDNETIVNLASPERVFRIKSEGKSSSNWEDRYFKVIDMNDKEKKIYYDDIINICNDYPEFCI